MIDENEKKMLISITNILNKLKKILFSYLNLLSPNSEKIKSSSFFNKNKSPNKKESNEEVPNDEIINSKVKNYFEEFKTQVYCLNLYLEEFKKHYDASSLEFKNYKHIKELSNIYNEQKNLFSKFESFKEKSQKNELVYLIFNCIANLGEKAIVQDSLKLENKAGYLLRSKNNQEINNIQNNLSIKVAVNNYIKKILNANIEFNIDIKGYMNIKYFPFIITIYFPQKNNSIFFKNKAILNIYFSHQKKETKDSILIGKIKTLFENRIPLIIKITLGEHKMNYFNHQNITEFMMHFLNYLNNYNDIMKTKCALCNQISKYSFSEKNFFPPYYKLFKTNKSILDNNIKNKEKENLFYHEECFKKISNPSL